MMITFYIFERTILAEDVYKRQEGNITNEINTSLNENEDSYVQTNKRTEQIDAMSSSANLEMVYKEIVDGNEIIIDGQIRVYVYADSEKKLRKKIKILTEKMENKGYKVSTQLGKALEDYKAISNINVNLDVYKRQWYKSYE